MASNNSSPDTRSRSGAQSAKFSPKAAPSKVDRGGGEKSSTREPMTGASVGGSFRMKVTSGAQGPDGTGGGTTHSAAARPPKNRGGSSGGSQSVGGGRDNGRNVNSR